jgi:FkbM family methyltransferase
MMAYLITDYLIGRSLELYGEFAESENKVMFHFVRPGDTVVDVGANVGTVTLALARRVGPTGVVHAFEPQPVIHRLLVRSLELNGLHNVRTHAVALGAQSGVIGVPDIDPNRPGNFGAAKLGGDAGALTSVVTLDGFNLPACRLLKIDAEGMDFEVLKGAEQTVRRHEPYVYMEAKAGPTTQAAIIWLRERGYRCCWHFAMYFSPDNFRNHAENVLDLYGDVNLMAIPSHDRHELWLPEISAPDADWELDYEAFDARRRAQD